MTVQNTTDKTFETDVLQAEGLVLVDFWAPWCGPCKMLGPILDEIAATHSGKLKIVKVDVDQNSQTATQHNVRTIPTMMMFQNGMLVDTKIGMLPKSKIIEWVESVTA